MNSCSQCGSIIPTGQSICSMCYGDVDFGRDGYYRQQMEEEERRNIELQQEQHQEQHQDHPDYLLSIAELNSLLDEDAFNKENPITDD